MIIDTKSGPAVFAAFFLAVTLPLSAQVEIPYTVSFSGEPFVVGIPFTVIFSVQKDPDGDEAISPFLSNDDFELREFRIFPEPFPGNGSLIRIEAVFLPLREGTLPLPVLVLSTGKSLVRLGPAMVNVRSKEGKQFVSGYWNHPDSPVYVGQPIFVRLSLPPGFIHGLSSAPPDAVWEPLGNGWLLTSFASRITLPGMVLAGETASCRVEPESLEFSALPFPLLPGSAIGSFSRSIEIDAKRAEVYDTLAVTVTVSGRGNLPFLDIPEPAAFLADGKRVYSQKRQVRKEGWIAGNSFYSGKIVSEFYFTPTQPGKFIIAIPPFPVFDPMSGKLSVLEGQRSVIEVQAPAVKKDSSEILDNKTMPVFGKSAGILAIKSLIDSGKPAEALAAAFKAERNGENGARETRIWLELSLFKRNESDIDFGGISVLLMIIACLSGTITLGFLVFLKRCRSPKIFLVVFLVFVGIFSGTAVLNRIEANRSWAVLREGNARLVPDLEGSILFSVAEGEVAEIEVDSSSWCRIRRLSNGFSGWFEADSVLKF